jgi:hypothetical protein
MHRPLFIAAILLLAASVPVLAQHGGHASSAGHGGMGSHGGFSGHVGAGHMGGGHSSGGMRFGSGFSSRTSARSSSFRQPRGSRGFNHLRGQRFRNHGFRNNCFGLTCRGFGYPWWYAGAFDSYWWWDNSSSYDEDREREIGLANEMNAQSLDEQRRRREERDQDVYARSAPAPARESDPQAVPATVLVFQDQHKQEIQNYAIVGQTLWNFAPQHTQKIALSDLDLPATIQANDERGVDFRVPAAHQGE